MNHKTSIIKQKIIYILKHNSIAQVLFRLFFNFLFRLLGIFVRTDSNLVVFVSMMGKKYNDSPRVIYEYLKSHEKYKDYHCIWAFEKPQDYPEVPSIKIDTLQYFIMLLKAGYWISSTNIQRGLSFKKKKTKWMYTCHGTAFKLCGNDCPGRKDFDYSSVNYICVQSKFDEYVMEKGFMARKDSFLECGRPCNDRLFHVSETDRIVIRKKMGIPDDKKVILYAPTWRDSIDGGVSYAIRPPLSFENWEKELGNQYVVLFRAHHITTKILNVQFNDFVRDVSLYPDVNDIMIASDILISDYSAILTDYAILERPIFCFAYDYDDYLKTRGTYFELDDFLPNKSCRTEMELIACIKNVDCKKEQSKTLSFRKKFIEFGGNATDTAVKALFS